MQTLLRIVQVISVIILLVMFLGASTIPLLDWLGFLDKQNTLTHTPFILKTLVLLTGLIGSSMVIAWIQSRLTTDGTLKDIYRNSEENNAKLTGMCSTVLSELGRSRLQSGRKEVYRGFLEALEHLPTDTEVCVTHFEKFYGAPYDEGDNQHEELTMKYWDQRIIANEIRVRQIVHVASRRDIDDVRARITKFKDCPNFTLSVVIGPPPRPFLDLAILGTQWASIDISSDSKSPYEANRSIELYDEATVCVIKEYFNIWWNLDVIPVKTRDGIDWNVVVKLSALSPEKYEDILFRPALFALFTASDDPTIFSELSALLQNLANLCPLLAAAPFRNQVGTTLHAATNRLLELHDSKVVFDANDAKEVYLTLCARAQQCLLCTSCGKSQSDFWRSDYGKRILAANKKAIERGVKVERIFIITSQCHKDRKLKADMREQKNMGIRVYVVMLEQIHAMEQRDVMVLDSSILFEYDNASQYKAGDLSPGSLTLISEHVSKAFQYFYKLQNLHAKEF